MFSDPPLRVTVEWQLTTATSGRRQSIFLGFLRAISCNKTTNDSL